MKRCTSGGYGSALKQKVVFVFDFCTEKAPNVEAKRFNAWPSDAMKSLSSIAGGGSTRWIGLRAIIFHAMQ